MVRTGSRQNHAGLTATLVKGRTSSFDGSLVSVIFRETNVFDLRGGCEAKFNLIDGMASSVKSRCPGAQRVLHQR